MGFIFLGVGWGFSPWESAEDSKRVTRSPPWAVTANMQVSSGPSRRPLAVDLLSGQKEAAAETLRQMEREMRDLGGREGERETRKGWNQMGLGDGRARGPLALKPGVAPRLAAWDLVG